MSTKTLLNALKQAEKEREIQNEIAHIQDNILGFNLGMRESATLQIGIPISPMLAKAIKDVEDIPKFYKKFQDRSVMLEYKYDGERTQIHYDGGDSIKMFSRNLENQNHKYEALSHKILAYLKAHRVKKCILDGEIVVFDTNQNKILTFQELQTTKQKAAGQEVSQGSTTHQHVVYLFDVVVYGDDVLQKKSLRDRKRVLEGHFPTSACCRLATSKAVNLQDKDYMQQIEAFLSESHCNQSEGLIIKSLDSTTFYAINNSRTQWAKLKKTSKTSNMADTLDLVPIAGYMGKGTRAGLFGAYLLAAYNKRLESLEAFCKLGTGFSDDFLSENTQIFKKRLIPSKPANYLVNKIFKPDVWFKAEEVWEV